MEIKAVCFDIGHTLVKYNNPLNWRLLYEPALKQVIEKCNIDVSDIDIKNAVAILSKYNTRENYREYEVTSEVIFKEILDVWKKSYDNVDLVRATFYDFFQTDAVYYDDVEEKDVLGANTLGIISVLIDRKEDYPNWNQKFTIKNLLDICKLI